HIDSINSKRQSTVEKKLDALIDKIKSLPDNQILKIDHLISTMIYFKGKTKGEILSPYLQNKANEFVTKSLNHQLRSFYMKLVQAEVAKKIIFLRFNLLLKDQKKLQKINFKW
ncbi:17406_t:CDS:2, partial [Racocetra fulgida]